MSFNTWMLQLSCCRTKSFLISLPLSFFLKSTCFVNHLLAHSSLAPLCFFVSIIFFLAFAYFKPILCSVLCTVQTFTSNSHFSFTFLAVTFFLQMSKAVSQSSSFSFQSSCQFIFSALSSFSARSLSSACIRPLISTASNPWRSLWCWGHLSTSSVPNKRLLLNAFYLIKLNCFAKKCPDYLCC